MGLFSSAKAKLAAQKLAEEHLYELAAEEIAANNIRPGLWAKAIAESDGDDAKTKARYIKLRVETMKAEADLDSYLAETASQTAANAKADADPKMRAIKFLKSQSYKVKLRQRDNYYRIDEPLGGRTGWKTEEEFMSYAAQRGFKA